jgi:hypothetical protein
MLPLHKLHVNGTRVVPVFFNTLVDPQPSASRSYDFGAVIGDVRRASGERIALIATGGMSHDPGELRHGIIDSSFGRRRSVRAAGVDRAARRAARRTRPHAGLRSGRALGDRHRPHGVRPDLAGSVNGRLSG